MAVCGLQELANSASLDRHVAASAAAPAAPAKIDFELIRIAESAEPQLPESLNFDLQISDMSKAGYAASHTLQGMLSSQCPVSALKSS